MGDSEFTAAGCTAAVHKALKAAEVGDSDYEVRSHKEDDHVISDVQISGWTTPNQTKHIVAALKDIEDAKASVNGKSVTLKFG
ncbi:MAG: hypothetical protein WC054_00610 [Candidatus Nanopelagicales bacterium]